MRFFFLIGMFYYPLFGEKKTVQCLDSSWKNRTVLRKNAGREGVSQFCLHKVNKNVKGGRNWTFCYNKSQIHIILSECLQGRCWSGWIQGIQGVDPGDPDLSLMFPSYFVDFQFVPSQSPRSRHRPRIPLAHLRRVHYHVDNSVFPVFCFGFLFTSRKPAVDFTKLFLT